MLNVKVIHKADVETATYDIKMGAIFTWGVGEWFYMRTNCNTKVCMQTGEVTPLGWGSKYPKLRIVDAELTVHD